MKRIVLLILTNLAVMLVLGTLCAVLGVDHYLTRRGLNLEMLLAFSAVMGFGGAFISLAMSKWIARTTMGVQVLTEPRSAAEAWLLATVEREARAAGIGKPEVGIFEAREPNAFATGMSRNNALVAVSSGLLRTMNQDEIEAVLGHEITHVANGDMVTMTLLQGVLNTFVYFLARVIGYFVDSAMRRSDDDRGTGIGYFITVMVMQLLLGVLASLIVCAFSRWREFRADAGGAHLAGRRKMVAALERLKRVNEPSTMPQSMAAFGIASGAASLFATHPPLDARIARLQQAAG